MVICEADTAASNAASDRRLLPRDAKSRDAIRPRSKKLEESLRIERQTEHQTRQRRLCLYILSLITSTPTAIAAIAAIVGRLGGGATAVTLSLPVIASGRGKAHIQPASSKRVPSKGPALSALLTDTICMYISSFVSATRTLPAHYWLAHYSRLTG